MPSYTQYKRQIAIMDDSIQWITVKGNHIPIRPGETKTEAINRFIKEKTTTKPQQIREKVLAHTTTPPLTDIKAYRKKTFEWYKANLQGTTVHNPVLGDILFSRRGGKHVIQMSAEKKLALVRFLPVLISKGNTDGWQPLNKSREDGWVAFAYVKSVAKVNNEFFDVGVVIAKDKNGRVFYDIGLNEHEGIIQTLTNESQAIDTLVDNNIIHDNEIVNIFLTPRKMNEKNS